jgi:hypothetical protein
MTVAMDHTLQTVLYSGLSAGIISVIVSVAIEKLGGKLGGLIAALPTTIVPAAIGLSMSLDQGHFVNTVYQVPLGIGCNILFLYFWKIVPPLIISFFSLKYLLILMSIGSISFWFLCVYLCLLLRQNEWMSNTSIGICAFAIHLLIGLAVTYFPTPAPKSSLSISKRVLFFRGFFAFTMISFAVYLSQLGNQHIAGFASVFPVIFFTTMLSLWMSQGSAVPTGAVGPMMLGSASASLYALLIPFAFTAFGYLWGTLFNWILCVLCISVPSFFWMQNRAKKVVSA